MNLESKLLSLHFNRISFFNMSGSRILGADDVRELLAKISKLEEVIVVVLVNFRITANLLSNTRNSVIRFSISFFITL